VDAEQGVVNPEDGDESDLNSHLDLIQGREKLLQSIAMVESDDDQRAQRGER